MEILRRNQSEVRWILDFYHDHRATVFNGLATLLTSKATGTFFDSANDFYFGEYPIQFAASVNDTVIFDLVLAFASTVELTVHEKTNYEKFFKIYRKLHLRFQCHLYAR